MGATQRFTRSEVQRILDVTEKQLDYWQQLRLIRPKGQRGQTFYDFSDLISLRTIKQLTEQGVPAHRLRRAVVALQQKLSTVQAPLTELRILSDGGEIVVEQDGARLEALSGQLVLNFDTRELDPASAQRAGGRVRVMPERTAEEWFALALEYEADPSSRAEAIDAYQQALAKKPDWIEALLNLGALLYEQGDCETAANCFHRAAVLEPQNPVAHYNLGSVLEEIGRLDAARAHLRRAVGLKPDYPDAHYNLAFVCEKLAAWSEARRHWRRYLELDPASPWCDYARQRLAEPKRKFPPPRPKRT